MWHQGESVMNSNPKSLNLRKTKKIFILHYLNLEMLKNIYATLATPGGFKEPIKRLEFNSFPVS